MAKSTNNAGNAKAGTMEGHVRAPAEGGQGAKPAGRRLESQAQGRSLLGAPRMQRNAKRATAAKMKTATAKRRSDRTSPASPGARTSAREQRAGAEGGASQPAAKTTARRTTTRTAAKVTTPKQAAQNNGRKGGTSSRRLKPITQHQSRDEILATVVADSGVERPIVERVARSLATTYTRHLMRNGSGRVEILDLGAALWRGKEGARAARKMASGILGGRIVEVPAREAMAVPRLRVHQALREIVARA